MNRAYRFLLASAAVTACALLSPGPADACAVFPEPGELPPVLGHKMILSLGMDQTTLWDQFSYKGNPKSFGWVLPTKGIVTVGVSSDALFAAVGEATAPEIYEPDLGCPNSCDSAGSGGGNSLGGKGDVTILAREQVGPYDTVQLAADDPAALSNWLQANNYPVPEGVQPILDAYVNEGFNFLAVKLVPGQTTEAIKPIRVTFDGAMPTFPMRLLNAGTGDTTDVTLFVVGDGIWLPESAQTVTIEDSELTWDYEADKSDYEAVRVAKLASTGGAGYLLETALPVPQSELGGWLSDLVQEDPDQGGYGGDPDKTAEEALIEDMDAFFANHSYTPTITRLVASLSKDGLKEDLQLEAADPSVSFRLEYNPAKTANEPECPPDPCAEDGDGEDGEGCAVRPAPARPGRYLSVYAALGFIGLVGLRAARRRRR